MGRRPDFEYVRRNAQAVFANAGEVVKLRTYVSGTTGTPKYGVGTVLNYTETTITGMFASNIFGAPRPTERMGPGGQTQEAQLMVTTERALGTQDEIIWQGTAYRLDGAAIPQVLGGRIMFRSPLKLAAGTG